MTKVEMIRLSDRICENYRSMDNELSWRSDEDKFRVAVLAAGIELLPGDIKSIVDNSLIKSVADAVDTARRRLTPDEKRKDPLPMPKGIKPIVPLEVFTTDEVQENKDNGIHPVEKSIFVYKGTKQFLEHLGVNNLEDINGYRKGNLEEGTVPMLLIGERWMPIPLDYFEDIEDIMASCNIPFREVV